ncbi:hypothetical protein WK78_09785 [Burkholderia cepacia]|nr:hypothetical protein WK78_09785 [Burkholderia cepacia]
MAEPFASECKTIHRQCGCTLRPRGFGQRIGHFEHEAIDTETWLLGWQRRIRFDLGHFRSNSRGAHGGIALLCVALLLCLPILFSVRTCGGCAVG